MTTSAMISALLKPGLRRVSGDGKMTDLHATSREKSQAQAERRVSRAGYAKGGRIHSDVKEDEKADKKLVERGVHQHERHDHKGEPETKLRLKRGGKVDGEDGAPRLDRRARGGSVKGKGRGLNIIIHNQPMHPAEKQQAQQQGMQQGMRVGAALGARQAAVRMGGGGGPPVSPPGGAAGAGPGRLPIAGPGGGGPPGMPPMGAPPQRPPGMMAHGGRLEEERVPVKAHTRRRAGGRV